MFPNSSISITSKNVVNIYSHPFYPMVKVLQDVKFTDINASTHPKSKTTSLKTGGPGLLYTILLLLYFGLFWAVISVALKQNKEKSHSIKEQECSSN